METIGSSITARNENNNAQRINKTFSRSVINEQVTVFYEN